MLSRLAFAKNAGKSFGGKRDLYEVLGYKKELDLDDYLARYSRQDIAQRIIDAFPNAIWTKKPKVRESDEETSKKSNFEKTFEVLAERTKLYHYLNRLDKLSGLGHYSVLLIGINDSSCLSEEVTQIKSADDIIYLMPFSELDASITHYEQNVNSIRYGLPTQYRIKTGGYACDNSSSMPTSTIEVHHSRVLHVAEGMLGNDVFGMPRLKPVFNRLNDLEKVVGGSAEIFWLNGRGGINLNADKDTEILEPEKLEEHAENYIHQLSRVLKTKGMEVKTLQLNIHEPTGHVSVLLDLISGATGIPKRILIGSERGELASSQDENNWLNRVAERRDTFCEPMVLRAFIDKLISMNALPKVDNYNIVWPELSTQSTKDKAEIANNRSNALATYANSSGADMIVGNRQFVEEVLNMEYNSDDIDKLVKAEQDSINADETYTGLEEYL